ncbi:MAG TPA: RMD1 family protein [Acetivibrio clariflavus]|nr:RMD1 family protein [Acetivibrio clariflavus]
MSNIKIKSIKVSSFFSLDKIAEFLGIPMQSRWDDYIILSGNHLDLVLKYNTKNKHVYIFKYGCISFANFEEEEISTFIKYIESMGIKINYSLIYNYYDVHEIEVLPNKKIKLWQNDGTEYDYDDTLIHIISIILSKSIELYRLESELDKLLDDAEQFITFLQRGRLGFYRRKSSLLISKILRFQYDSIHNIRILDRPGFVEQSMHLKAIYASLSEYYELDERLEIVEGKIASLHDILDLYSNLSFNQSETRLILFEIFLLALFPAFHILEHLFKTVIPINFFINLLK